MTRNDLQSIIGFAKINGLTEMLFMEVFEMYKHYWTNNNKFLK